MAHMGLYRTGMSSLQVCYIANYYMYVDFLESPVTMDVLILFFSKSKDLFSLLTFGASLDLLLFQSPTIFHTLEKPEYYRLNSLQNFINFNLILRLSHLLVYFVFYKKPTFCIN